MERNLHQSLELLYAMWRLGYVLLGWGLVLLLWRRPRPGVAVGGLVALNVVTWWAYLAPCQRPYGTSGTDRLVNLASAAVVAAGGSPWEHAQVGVASFEPFWDLIVATLSGFHPGSVVAAYESLTPIVITLVALGLYFGLGLGNVSPPEVDPTDDRWERLLTVVAVLGLSSISMVYDDAFWVDMFLFKPNHGASYALWGVLLGLVAGGYAFWIVGLVLGALVWVHVVDGGFAIAALTLGVLLQPVAQRHLKRWWLTLLVAAAAAGPYVGHLTRDFNPFRPAPVGRSVWRSPGSVTDNLLLDRMTLDLGLLLLLGVVGAAILWKRRRPRDRMILAVLMLAGTLAVASTVLAPWQIVPYPNKINALLRFGLALSAGAALAAGGQLIAKLTALDSARAHLVVLALCLPLTFPATWNPWHDRYFVGSLEPAPQRYAILAEWAMTATPQSAVFATMGSVSLWLPALSGRRVVLFGPQRPPHDAQDRSRAIEILYRSPDPRLVRETAGQYGVTYVVFDPEAMGRVGRAAPVARAAYRRVFRYGNTRVYEIVPPHDRRQPARGSGLARRDEP